MSRWVALVALVGLWFTVGGCAMPYGSPVYGGVITNRVKGPVGGIDNSVKPSKTGMAEATGIVLFAAGDASISAAMANGGITKVHHVDSESFSVMGFYASYKTIVYGE